MNLNYSRHKRDFWRVTVEHLRDIYFLKTVHIGVWDLFCNVHLVPDDGVNYNMPNHMRWSWWFHSIFMFQNMARKLTLYSVVCSMRFDIERWELALGSSTREQFQEERKRNKWFPSGAPVWNVIVYILQVMELDMERDLSSSWFAGLELLQPGLFFWLRGADMKVLRDS